MRRRQFFAVLGMVALTSITSCTSFSSSRNPSMDKTGWITHCFGRFLIDLPPQAEIRAGYYLWGDNIEALDETPVTLATRVDQTEQELKSQLHRRAQGSMFLRRLDLGGARQGCFPGNPMPVQRCICWTLTLFLNRHGVLTVGWEVSREIVNRRALKVPLLWPTAYVLAKPTRFPLSPVFVLTEPISRVTAFKVSVSISA